ncbi:glycosyl hydrolase family 8 [Lysinibacillus cavernae]|uniref:glycosyl hydrolase family 8 n=1 Tax=Lysinibacillus cavernae TaxID=2666135 RepID=UPI0012D9ED85|nr:glycosyl hydrolase family 8 [Lysinibacillus cavernae]
MTLKKIVKFKWFLLISSVVLLSISCTGKKVALPKEPLSPTEQFVIQDLMNDKGLLSTDLTNQNDLYLSESIGLWLAYLLEKDDQTRFNDQMSVMKSFFLTNDFIVWRIEGSKKASVNALIDDLRIIRVLLEAGEKWQDSTYVQLGKKIGDNLVQYGMNQELFVDFVDIHSHHQANTLTMSYIMPSAFQQMEKHGLLSQQQVQQQVDILQNAPIAEEGFFPKYYDIPSKQYVFDEELHMIDQLYTAYHLASTKSDTVPFKDWLLNLLKRDGKLYGRYNAQTNQPTVSYESPAVYAMAARYMLAIGERQMAQQFIGKMADLKDASTGYVDKNTQSTHSFDNLLPLLAEREVENAYNND